MALLGVDYGAKKIGLAKGDKASGVATPLKTIANHGQESVRLAIEEICRDENVEQIVVGVPLSLHPHRRTTFLRQKDLQNQQMREVIGFIEWLRQTFDLPVEIEDERLSTKQANGLTKDLIQQYGDDAVAAMFILQTFLDKEKNS